MNIHEVARLAVGRKTIPNGRTVERATVVGKMVSITFAGTGLAPFREARYTPKEVVRMVGLSEDGN
jgi:hypothetical protein